MLRIALAGLSGWMLRLLFAATVAAGGYGVYVAWFASLGEHDPGHDRLVGSAVYGSALGASLAVLLLLCLLAKADRSIDPASYAWAYAAFFALFMTALTLSSALRSIGDWERSNLSVHATMWDCTESDPESGGGRFCVFSWTVNGVQHTQSRRTYGVYADGTPTTLWVDPVTGGADAHSGLEIGAAFLGTLVCLGGVALAGAGVVLRVRDGMGMRRWLRTLAWWRLSPPPVRPQRASASAAEVEDAVPADWKQDAIPAPWVEDARPPGPG